MLQNREPEGSTPDVRLYQAFRRLPDDVREWLAVGWGFDEVGPASFEMLLNRVSEKTIAAEMTRVARQFGVTEFPMWDSSERHVMRPFFPHESASTRGFRGA